MEARKPYLYEAILSFSFLILCMAVGIAVYGANPHIPMLIGTAFAAVMAIKMGYKWKEIEDSMFQGILQAMQAIIILAIIGVLIGVWLQAGVVPTMIYYGLKILSPQIFLVAAVIICSITSLATGTSWGTAGTIGVALMGVATGLGIPAPIAAGAIISGSYFGDKMSPLSDTTNLAPAMAGTDVFTHVKFMMKPTLIAYAITLVFFGVIGMRFGAENVDFGAIETIKQGLSDSFRLSPLLLLPPVIVIFSIAKKMPAIPGIFLGIISGAILGMVIQGSSFGDILNVGYNGYESTTGIEVIDS
ncbi:MAG: Na+/H+ antiporter NhaC, partial [Clostridia bacterium]|nr:Na+/H+ antiporter NhaC [Clostridia bacterium]